MDSAILKFPCKVCSLNVKDNDKAILCNICDSWVHMTCNQLNYVDYKHLQSSSDPWFCISCCSDIFPFGSLNNKLFYSSVISGCNFSEETCKKDTSVILDPPPNLSLLFNQFNNISPEKNSDPENIANSKYFDINEIQTLKVKDFSKALSLFHINACSLNKNFDDLQHLLKCTNKKFDIIGVTETRINKSVSHLCNLNLPNYAFESTPTECPAGGTLLYIANHISYKPRKDLNIYK